jgi:hypothetical protein
VRRHSAGTANVSAIAAFVIKHAPISTLVMKEELVLKKSWLDEIHIKVDSVSGTCLLHFISRKEKKCIDGFYFVWDKKQILLIETSTTFGKNLNRGPG